MLSFKQLVRIAVPGFRLMSAGPARLVDIADDGGIAVVTLQRAPVNSLNLELLQAMNNALDDVAKNKPRGMILTSGLPTVYSAGVDINELYKPDLKRLQQFATTLQDVWKKLFGFPFATAAAINGHAPAGGCCLAMSCEYRVMVSGKYRIGLNETALGIVVNEYFMDTMCHTIGTRQTELALTTGKMFNVDEALQVGLIDETASDTSDAIEKCKRFIKRFDKIPPSARTLTKLRIRQRPLENMEKTREKEIVDTLEFAMKPEIQQGLEDYMKSLKIKAST
ncbi:enoyl-CoA delta isomerase 1, mitochondrial-like [Leguminivora glycinivorella]|uniref:enoyl-CoA delta isomerase 1, mitochondrial-like n=1 Tax=Leguminivora glycinivorella TaxID=1035111 RepID=UPI00200C451C|nr:enoyl-CoA delta isomerase 1, mitochondrial-like [Leguminivora glycinivorella]